MKLVNCYFQFLFNWRSPIAAAELAQRSVRPLCYLRLLYLIFNKSDVVV